MNAIVTQTRAMPLVQCKCGTYRLPELQRFKGRTLAQWIFCRACGHRGPTAYAPERAAAKWNEQASR